MLGYRTHDVATIFVVFHSFATFWWTADTGDDFMVTYNGSNISIISILRRLNITGDFRFSALCQNDQLSCRSRCTTHEAVDDIAERKNNLPCYCDNQCLDVGDCCYDLLSSCPQAQARRGDEHKQWQCVNMNSSGSHGYVMNTKCPPGNGESEIQRLCETVDTKDFLSGMPVVDGESGVVYRNVFCARCNSVQVISYWQMNADCGRIPASALPQDNRLLLDFIRENCTVRYRPTAGQQINLKHCVFANSTCFAKQVVNNEPILKSLCSYYSFPVCGNPHYKNPHCALCTGEDITQFNCGCLSTATGKPPVHTTKGGSATPLHSTVSGVIPPTPAFGEPLPHPLPLPTTWPPLQLTTPPGTIPPTTHFTNPGFTSQTGKPPKKPLQFAPQPPAPPLSILFDFSSDSNQISIHGTKTETKFVNLKTCKEGFVYDPFVEKCREAFRRVIGDESYSVNSTNSTNNNLIKLNCSGIRLHLSDAVLYPNGTLWVPMHSTGYDRTEYFVKGSIIFLCTDFESNYSKNEIITTWSYVSDVTPLQILTYAGCSLSVFSLLILLVIYCVFKELKTLPGKNLINLSISMVCYHMLLFGAGLRTIQEVCTGIAVLLHYFLMCSFAWMSVMAFDVTKTFVFHDTNLRSDQEKRQRKTFRKYCLCAWGLPATAVATCFLFDHTEIVYIGYGQGGFCWMENGTALLFAVGVPVAFVILFNFVALTWTAVAIYRVRKVTRQLEDQRGHPSLALLCIKLTCVFGLTWVIGFLSSIVKAEATTYLFVIVNSLQGFFIFLAFVAKKRTIALLRGPRKNHHESGQENNDTLDTKL